MAFRPDHTKIFDSYFIIKSTLEVLEQSVRDEIWVTQAHNEEALKVAYEVMCHPYAALEL
jgi:hypothetical protein